MSLSEFEYRKIEKAVQSFMEKRRPPVDLRDEVDLQYRVDNQSIEIFEVRPLWSDPSEKIEEAIAKATYVKSHRIWKVYWQRADLKWHRYDPDPEVASVEEFLALVDRDEFACFFG